MAEDPGFDLNGVCRFCQRPQRTIGGEADGHFTYIAAPHLLAVRGKQWLPCPGGGQPPTGWTSRPVDEAKTVGEASEAQMVNLLCHALISHGWTVHSPNGVALPPLTVATDLVGDMLRVMANGERR